MLGPKLDARSYAILVLAALGVGLSVTLVAQQGDTQRVGVEDPAEATRQVAEANREVARSNEMIAEAIGELAEAAREIGDAVESVEPGLPDAPAPPDPPGLPDEPAETPEPDPGVFEFQP